MITSKETAFLKRNEVCRFATISRDAGSHIVLVCYVFQSRFSIASDYRTKKYKNVLEKVTLVVDTYKPRKAVPIEVETKIPERGEEFRRTRELFYKRFEGARKDSWEEGGSQSSR